MNKLPKLKYPPIRASEDNQKTSKKTSHQLLNLLLSIDNATFEKIYPQIEQTHES